MFLYATARFAVDTTTPSLQRAVVNSQLGGSAHAASGRFSRCAPVSEDADAATPLRARMLSQAAQRNRESFAPPYHSSARSPCVLFDFCLILLSAAELGFQPRKKADFDTRTFPPRHSLMSSMCHSTAIYCRNTLVHFSTMLKK